MSLVQRTLAHYKYVLVSMITSCTKLWVNVYMSTEQQLSTFNGPQSLTNLSLSNQKALTVIHYPRSLFKGSFGDAKYSVSY